MDKNELKMRLKAQRIASQKGASAEKKKSSSGMSHLEQLNYQVKVWEAADRQMNHALRHIRSLSRSANLSFKDADDETLIDMFTDEQWARICGAYNEYLLAGINMLTPHAQTLDAESAKTVNAKSPTETEAIRLMNELRAAIVAGDKKLQKELEAQIVKLS